MNKDMEITPIWRNKIYPTSDITLLIFSYHPLIKFQGADKYILRKSWSSTQGRPRKINEGMA